MSNAKTIALPQKHANFVEDIDIPATASSVSPKPENLVPESRLTDVGSNIQDDDEKTSVIITEDTSSPRQKATKPKRVRKVRQVTTKFLITGEASSNAACPPRTSRIEKKTDKTDSSQAKQKDAQKEAQVSIPCK